MRVFISKTEIEGSLREVGLIEGDVVFLHIDTSIVAQIKENRPNEGLHLILQSLKDIIGFSGTIIVPTFSYSFCRQEKFDPNSSESHGVGHFAEFFRKLPGVVRSLDPIFSVAAHGHMAREVCDVSLDECFGPQSVFGKIHRFNAKILCLGCSLDRATFVHYCEKSHGVDYRYDKIFEGQVLMAESGPALVAIKYFVRDYSFKLTTDLTLLKKVLKEKRQLKVSSIGRVGLLATCCKDFFDAAREILDQDMRGLTKSDEDVAL